MDGDRFDALTRAAASAPSRRSLLGAALGAIAGVALGDRANAAARKRAPGAVCRKAGDCASGVCLPKDAAGRRRCGCTADADCPAPRGACRSVACDAGVCVTAEAGGVGAACVPPTFWSDSTHPGDPIGFPGTGCCAGLVCQGLWYTGAGTCGVNRTPVAVDGDVKHPWKKDCVPVNLTGYDADGDAFRFQTVDYPQHGFLTEFIAFGAADVGGAPPFTCLDGSPPPEPNDARNSVDNQPPGWNAGGLTSCAEGVYLTATLCYVPNSTTFTGTDSFTFSVTDVFGAVSAPALFTVTIFEA